MDVKWIKISTELFNNRKIRQISSLPDGDAIIVLWIQLLCLAGDVNDGGLLYLTKDIPYTPEMLSTQFNKSIEIVALAIKTFEEFGMIEVDNGILIIANWEKYQNIDRLKEIREYNRKAQQKSREKRKKKANVNDMSLTCQRGHETDLDIDKDIDININKEIITFKPPSATEIEKYIREKNYSHVDADTFFSYYESNGWKVGNVDMNNWQASVDVWEIRDKKKAAGQKNNQFNNFEQRKRTEKESAALEKKLLGVM